MKYFSVIVPTLNSLIIGRTIRSLEQQTFDRKQYEVIVVGMDNPGIVRESDLIRFDRTLTPLPPAQARNRGARHSQAKILVFIDADCIAHSDWLEILAHRFVDPEIVVVGGGVESDTRNYWTLADNLSMFHESWVGLPRTQRRLLPSLNLAVRREAFLEVGGFNERYPRASGEDADLTMRLRRRGYVLHFEPHAIVRHEPLRHRLGDLLHHAYYQGKYSTKVDPDHLADGGLPWPLHTQLGVALFAPLLATAATARVFHTPSLWRYWYTAPAIWIAKMAWCMGAIRHFSRQAKTVNPR